MSFALMNLYSNPMRMLIYLLDFRSFNVSMIKEFFYPIAMYSWNLELSIW